MKKNLKYLVFSLTFSLSAVASEFVPFEKQEDEVNKNTKEIVKEIEEIFKTMNFEETKKSKKPVFTINPLKIKNMDKSTLNYNKNSVEGMNSKMWAAKDENEYRKLLNHYIKLCNITEKEDSDIIFNKN